MECTPAHHHQTEKGAYAELLQVPFHEGVGSTSWYALPVFHLHNYSTATLPMKAGDYWLSAQLYGTRIHWAFISIRPDSFVVHTKKGNNVETERADGQAIYRQPRTVRIAGAAKLTEMETEKLQGEWRAVSIEHEYRKLADAMVERADIRLRFSGDRVAVHMKETQETRKTDSEGPYDLNRRKDPGTLDLPGAFDGRTMLCQYRLWTTGKLEIVGSATERPLDCITGAGRRRFLFERAPETPVKPPSPPLPKVAADVPKFWVGTWKSDSEILVPKKPPEEARFSGVTTMSLVADGKFLRGRTTHEHGQFETLLVQGYNEQKQNMLGWFFMSDGSATGPGIGIWDADKRTLLWMERVADGIQSIHQFEFVDSDTVKARLFSQNEKNEIIFDLRNTFTRLKTSVVQPPMPVDPKRPPEMKVLDRLIGEWRNQVKVTTAESPDKPSEQTARKNAKSILGGRMVEVFDTNESTTLNDYWLTWFDPNTRKYRIWFFSSGGLFTEMDAEWDETKKTMNWTSIDKTVAGHWNFKNDDMHETPFAIKDKAGRMLIDVSGSSRRSDGGWIRLFNGKDLDGLVPIYDRNKLSAAPWEIDAAALLLKGGNKGQDTGYVRTQKQYREFHLRFEYKHTSTPAEQATILLGMHGPDDPSKSGGATARVQLALNKLNQPMGAFFAGKEVNEKLPWTNIYGGEVAANQWGRVEIVSRAGELEVRINEACKIVNGYQPVVGHLGFQSSRPGLQLRGIEIKGLPTD